MAPGRRQCLARLAGAAAALAGVGGCASPPGALADWHARLRGNTVALLGEVHDHPALHRRRLADITAAIEAGWRPAVVMEQFDTDRQADLDRARRERPRDAAHLIAQAGASRGWDWPLYEPLVALALQRELPLLAGNLSRSAATRVVREGYAAVFDAGQRERLGLERTLPADLLDGQSREIETGHCNALPASVVPAMARAQFARDAVLAERIGSQAAGGVLLIAGNGHVRRDLGVPRWLASTLAARCLVVGYLETGPQIPPGAFDAVVLEAPVARPDPCAGFTAPPAPAGRTS